jgi:uncharacterized protein (DUF736 family)|tara:strand:+ start:1676 stop:1927 length:252 start_codon:yes stop_codon:yes gene_type:complete
MDDVNVKINLFKNEYKKDEKHPSYTNNKIRIEHDIPAGVYSGALWGGKTKDGIAMVSLKIATPMEKPPVFKRPSDDEEADIPF